MEIIPISRVKSIIEFRLDQLLDTIASLLRSNIISIPIIVDKKSMTVISGHKLYAALKTLGVKRIPITWEESEEEIKITLDELGFYEDIKPSKTRVFKNTLELLYLNWPTPLVKLTSLSNNKFNVWAKLESYNPFSNSIKDRVGWYMIKDALSKGVKFDLLYEATSGNTGVALASISAILGVKVKLFVPQVIQKVTDTYLKIIGADVVRVSKSLTVEFLDEVETWAKRDKALNLNQFENNANFLVHLRYTAKGLDLQLKDNNIKPSIIIGGIGTSGHMSALSLYFKNRYRDKIQLVAVQPSEGEKRSHQRGDQYSQEGRNTNRFKLWSRYSSHKETRKS